MEIIIGVLCLLSGMIVGSIFCIMLIKWAFEYEKKLFELIVTDETHDPIVYPANEMPVLNTIINNKGDDYNESEREEARNDG